MIDIKNVSKWYGSFQVLTDCSTEVKKGEVFFFKNNQGRVKTAAIDVFQEV